MSTTNPLRLCAVDAQVVRCDAVCREHVRIEVRLGSFPASTPGQFLQLQCAAEPTSYPLLRRPFSIADRWRAADGDHLVIISRAIGTGTRWLETLRPGDALNLTGPLGKGYRLPEGHRPLVLVGGGVGIPPLLYLARHLHAAGHDDVTVVFGVLTHDLLPVTQLAAPTADGTPHHCLELPGEAAYPASVTSDDGTLGLRGRVTDGLAALRDAIAARGRPLVYACGPEPMLKAIADQTRAFDWDAQLCIERLMGCGLGTCLSCIVKIPDPAAAHGWRWALSCTDGPVFERDALLELASPA